MTTDTAPLVWRHTCSVIWLFAYFNLFYSRNFLYKNYFRKPQDILRGATHLFGDTAWGRACLLMQEDDASIEIMPCLQVRAAEQAVGMPGFPTANTRGEQRPKESCIWIMFGWGEEGSMWRQLLLCIYCTSLSRSPGQANSAPTVASPLKINPTATAETSLHTKFFKEKCNACIRPRFLPFKYTHRSLPRQKKASISLTFPLP